MKKKLYIVVYSTFYKKDYEDIVYIGFDENYVKQLYFNNPIDTFITTTYYIQDTSKIDRDIIKPKTILGYDEEDLMKIAMILKEKNWRISDIEELKNNISYAIEVIRKENEYNLTEWLKQRNKTMRNRGLNNERKRFY